MKKKLKIISVVLILFLLFCSCGNSNKQNIETTQEETTVLETKSEDNKNIISKKEYSIGNDSEIILSVSLDDNKNFYFDVSIKSDSLPKATAIYNCILPLKRTFNDELNAKSNITVTSENKILMQYDNVGTFVMDTNTNKQIDINNFFDFSLSSKQRDKIEKEWLKIQDNFVGTDK